MPRRAVIGAPADSPLRHPWLDPTQRLLLLAGVGDGDAATAAWRQFTERQVSLDELDPAAQRLLPLVYRNLASVGFAGNLTPVKRRYESSWYRNQILRHHGARALHSLSQAGIETIVLKGAALSAVYYLDAGVRPMDDFDILVPAPATEQAVATLRADGWITDDPDPTEAVLRHHGTALSRPGGGRLDLHWDLLWQSPGDDVEAWSASRPLELAGTATRRLDPADQLLHVCVHGSSASEVAPIRWAADAVSILRHEGSAFPWDRLIQQSARRELTVTTHSMLAYLLDELAAPVPVGVLEALTDRRASRTERLAHRARVTPHVRGRKLAMVWERYRKLAVAHTGSTGPLGLASFLQSLWRLEHRRQLPGELVRRTMRHGFSREH